MPVPKEPTTIGDHLRRRRLELGIFQSEAARRLGVSTVTLSRWECDKVYPTWGQQPGVVAYLGFDPFADSILGGPKGNESSGVAFLSSNAPVNIGQEIMRRRLEMKKNRTQFAKELGVDAKTLRGWEAMRHKPSSALWKRVAELLRLAV